MKIMPIFGTRPEGIKMAPLVTALHAHPETDCVFVNTAQHREMLDQVLDLFAITPAYDLDCMRDGQTPESLTASIITGLAPILAAERPDLVLVHGDTTTTFAAAYAAFLQQIPVGHVEAGLRTNERYSPFPEEMNRSLVGRIASMHFAATEKNRQNLLLENVADSDIFVVGNTVIDALLQTTVRPFRYPDSLAFVTDPANRVLLLTTHRRENLAQLEGIYQAVNQLLETHPDLHVVFPVHKNPLVRKQVADSLCDSPRVHITEPLDYETFSHLLGDCHLVLSDSGGIQEEAPALGKPVLVARTSTERPEGVAAGTLKLVGTDQQTVYSEADALLRDPARYAEMEGATNPYGDGTSSEQILEAILNSRLSKKTSHR